MTDTYIVHGDIIHAPALDAIEHIPDGYVAVRGGRVAGIYGELPAEYAHMPLHDYRGRLVTQALCDMHLHAPQYPMLGMGIDLPLLEWLNTYTFATEARFDDVEYARRVYDALAAKLVSVGTTRVCMFSSVHTDSTLALMQALEDAGISGYVGKVNMDRNCPLSIREDTERSIAETERFIDEALKRFKRVRPIITPRFTPACSDDLMTRLGELARASALPIQSHMSENADECAWVLELCPDCSAYWETYHKRGLFGEKTIVAHCVFSDEAERAAIARCGAWVAHCPDSNVNLCSGVAPLRKMLDERLNVVLGSDIAGGAQLSMLQVAAMAVKSAKLRSIATGGAEGCISATEALYLATSAGQVFFGEQPGFAQGNEFHAIVIDDRALQAPPSMSPSDRIGRALYTTESADIEAVYACRKL
ncbi:MAG: amidohydrolase family protein [Clostridia bacterium]|nr:amidohydrolase family protein [Clostridia bacterium]